MAGQQALQPVLIGQAGQRFVGLLHPGPPGAFAGPGYLAGWPGKPAETRVSTAGSAKARSLNSTTTVS